MDIRELIKGEKIQNSPHTSLTLQEAASGMHPEWQGGQILPGPIKTSLEAILTQFFDITLIWGQK